MRRRRGRYRETGGRLLMPLSVQVHHSFVDGLHVGKFADLLQNYLNGAEIFTEA